jgi:ADP-ribose pyrophosphatase YjhB (NUDIX family)
VENEILNIAKRIQAIAQTGLHFTENVFDRERYEELRELSVLLAVQVVEAPFHKIRDLFTFDRGYQTPKIDIRAVVLKDEQMLFARERIDNKWSLPGGFADVNYSPKEVAEKEVREETGLEVIARRALAIIDCHKHSFPPAEFHYYKIIIFCEIKGGELRGSIETSEAKFFPFDNLPELSLNRINAEVIEIIKQQIDNNLGMYCD